MSLTAYVWGCHAELGDVVGKVRMDATVVLRGASPYYREASDCLRSKVLWRRELKDIFQLRSQYHPPESVG